MGLTKKSDGRYVVGKGIADGNEYKGSAAWRDIVIQYSGDGATEKSLEYLTFLKDYALYHSAQGNPVIPPNVQIWMSTANTMKAVEADDITVDGETVKIGACTWDGSDWSFAEPTPGGGGSSLPAYTSTDKGKFLGLGDGEPVETEVTVIPEQTLTFTNIGRPDTPQYAATIAAPNFTGLSNGQDVTVYIDGTAYSCTYSSDPDQITGEGDVYKRGGTWYFEITLEGTWTGSHTISATADILVTPTTTTVVVPEQTVTMSETEPSPGLTVWVGQFNSCDEDFFSSASAGDTAIFVVDNGSPVESVAIEQYGMVLFPVGDFLIGDGTGVFFDGVGIAALTEPASESVTVSGTISVPSVEPKWEAARREIAKVNVSYDTDHYVCDISADDFVSAVEAGKLFAIQFSGENELRFTSPILAYGGIMEGTYYTLFSGIGNYYLSDTNVTANFVEGAIMVQNGSITVVMNNNSTVEIPLSNK